jgi:DNA-binding NarL/FixJ family response regulator
MKKTPIRIIIIDDNKIIRDLYKKQLENSQLFTVVADYEEGLTAIHEVKKINPDIILVDINISPVNGFYITENILKINPTFKIIALSVKNESIYAKRMIEMGAKGYLTKTSTIEEVIEGILEVYDGKNYICKEVRKKMNKEDKH